MYKINLSKQYINWAYLGPLHNWIEVLISFKAIFKVINITIERILIPNSTNNYSIVNILVVELKLIK